MVFPPLFSQKGQAISNRVSGFPEIEGMVMSWDLQRDRWFPHIGGDLGPNPNGGSVTV